MGCHGGNSGDAKVWRATVVTGPWDACGVEER